MDKTQGQMVPFAVSETKLEKFVSDAGKHPYLALMDRILSGGRSKSTSEIKISEQDASTPKESAREEKRRRWGIVMRFKEARGMVSMDDIADKFCNSILDTVKEENLLIKLICLGKSFEVEREKMKTALEWEKDDISPGDIQRFTEHEQTKKFCSTVKERVRIQLQVLCEQSLRDAEFDQMLKPADIEEFKRQSPMQPQTNNFFNVTGCPGSNFGSQQTAVAGNARYAEHDINEYAAPQNPDESSSMEAAATPGTPPKKGAPERHLFTVSGKKDEDTTERMVGKFAKCLSRLKLHGQQVSTQKDILNKVVASFVRWCMETGRCDNTVSGAAVARFIIDDCGLEHSVEPKAYGDFIGRAMKDKDFYSEFYAQITDICA